MGTTIGIVVRVVVGEGDGCADVRAGSTVREFAPRRPARRPGLCARDAVHRAGEAGSSADGARLRDDLTIALAGDLVRTRHRQGRGVLRRCTAPCSPTACGRLDEGGPTPRPSGIAEKGAGASDGEADECWCNFRARRTCAPGIDSAAGGGPSRRRAACVIPAVPHPPAGRYRGRVSSAASRADEASGSVTPTSAWRMDSSASFDSRT